LHRPPHQVRLRAAPAGRVLVQKLSPFSLPFVGVSVRTNIDVAAPPRLALTREEAARSLGMSVDSFERHVQPEIRLVRRGKLRVVPIADLNRWLDVNMSQAVA
jgi:hypothetical protein